MKLYDLAELAAHNLRESVLRNGLTTVGIAVGVASLVAMLSLGVGLQQLANSRLSRSGLFDTIVVSEDREARGSDPPGEAATQPANPRVLDDVARKEISGLPYVVDVQPDIRFPAEVEYQKRTHVVPVGALPASARENEAFDDIQGRFFSGATASEVILKTELAKELNPANPAAVIGQDLVLRFAERKPLEGDNSQSAPPPSASASNSASGSNDASDEGYGFTVVRREKSLRVVGIIDTEPYGGIRAVSRASVFIPEDFAESLNIMQAGDVRGAMGGASNSRAYSTLMARISNPTQVPTVEDAVKRMGFRTFSILDAAQSLRRFFGIVDLFLGIFGSLALVVASLGIINTLVMAVLERRREIGIMKALGASDGDVKTLFFAEAGVMGLCGGLAGVGLGWAISRAINVGTRIYLARRGMPPETVSAAPLWLVAAAIAFAIVVSLASGLYPAARAAKLDPVRALRYE